MSPQHVCYISLYTPPSIFLFQFGDCRYVYQRRNGFGEGEEKQFGDEMLRLGRKYVKAMNAVERQILHHTLYYYYLVIASEFEHALNQIVTR